jgi:hypothetical protein
MSRMTQRAALLTVLVLLVAGASGAEATDGRAAANKLTGCRNTTTGTLDQVKAGLLPIGGACGSGEVAVTWNKTGPRGPQGPTGATGATGATGVPGVSGWEMVTSTSAYTSISPRQQVASCPAGKKVVGGGGAANPVAVLYASHPLSGGDAWSVLAIESPATSANWYLDAFAICVTALP